MKMQKNLTLAIWLAAATLLTPSAAVLAAQNATSPAAPPAKPAGDRSPAYYHSALAAIYADDALSQGRPEMISKAIEEYKLALNADPGSPAINDALAELYFGAGRVREAEATARNLLKTAPDDIDAHKLLGRIYLRQLGEGQSGSAVLEQAVAVYEKLATLEPKSVEHRMILGQLYTIKHDAKKAEAAFAAARAIEPDSEEVILNMARFYADSGDVARAAQVIEQVPESERTPKMEFTLGAADEQLKKLPAAIAAYQRALDMDRGDLHTIEALAQALNANNQLDEALEQYRALAAADPENGEALIKVGDILRRQGHFQPALEVIQKARKMEPNSLEGGYNEGLLLDILGRYDDAIRVYSEMVDLTSHANGAYTEEEKGSRSFFLERLGAVCLEQNRTEQALAAYQKMIDMGGDAAARGFQGQVDVYRAAKQYDKAIEVSRKAVEADPKNHDLKMMLAGELADHNQADEGFKIIKSLLTNTVEDRSLWITMVQMHIRLHMWKEAEEDLNKVESYTTKKDDRVYLLFLRGENAERQKRYEQAEQYFRQVLDLDPANALTLNYYGYMLADKAQRLPEALKLIRKAVEQEPMNGAYLDSLGWCYLKMGDYELAEENLKKAVDRDQTDPTVHDHLGDLYEKTGRIHLAAAQWEIALKQFAVTSQGDFDPSDVAKVQKKLENARTKMARQDSVLPGVKPE
jgi:tetratricopeptide (TPR) repeat protein